MCIDLFALGTSAWTWCLWVLCFTEKSQRIWSKPVSLGLWAVGEVPDHWPVELKRARAQRFILRWRWGGVYQETREKADQAPRLASKKPGPGQGFLLLSEIFLPEIRPWVSLKFNWIDGVLTCADVFPPFCLTVNALLCPVNVSFMFIWHMLVCLH